MSPRSHKGRGSRSSAVREAKVGSGRDHERDRVYRRRRGGRPGGEQGPDRDQGEGAKDGQWGESPRRGRKGPAAAERRRCEWMCGCGSGC